MAERRSRARGFTLIEVLVAIVVVAVGLLGLVGLHVRLQQAEFEAYNRAQALVLLDAIVDRINANRATAQCYAVTANDEPARHMPALRTAAMRRRSRARDSAT